MEQGRDPIEIPQFYSKLSEQKQYETIGLSGSF